MTRWTLLVAWAACVARAGAWHSTGHMIVAQIAYRDLKKNNPSVINDVDQILSVLTPFSKDGSYRFIESAAWPDDLKGVTWDSFNDWHYHDYYYVRDYKPGPLPDNPTNIVWALNECVRTIKAKKDNKGISQLSKSFMLRFLFHLIGDIHQPLHNVSLVDADFPEGDKGGNKFKIDAGGVHDLHSYWDKALASLTDYETPLSDSGFSYVDGQANDLMAAHPRSSFADDLREKDFAKWSMARVDEAKTVVYDGIKPGDKPSTDYVTRGLALAQTLIALSGYRLADTLTDLVNFIRHEEALLM